MRTRATRGRVLVRVGELDVINFESRVAGCSHPQIELVDK